MGVTVRLVLLFLMTFVVDGAPHNNSSKSSKSSKSQDIIYVTDNPYLTDVTERKTIATKTVEGCYASDTKDLMMWQNTGTLYDFGDSNSNHKCQKKCRETAKILAATQGHLCHCGNIFPAKRQADDTKCRTPCASFSDACYSPQECCGGTGHYSLSVVGDIDVAREILERIRAKYLDSVSYKQWIRKKFKEYKMSYREDLRYWYCDWSDSMEKEGWSNCHKDDHDKFLYLHGLYRGMVGLDGFEGLGLIGYADCRPSPFGSTELQECKNADWMESFDKAGWSTCDDGYFITGLYRVGKSQSQGLFNLEQAKCCRQPTVKWGECIEHEIPEWAEVDKGDQWSSCPLGFYMTGLYRSSCEKLRCLEKFKCCKMKSDLVFAITVKDLKEKYTKKCTMTLEGTYEAEKVSEPNEVAQLELKTEEFSIEDQSTINLARPEPIAGFKPKICSPRTNGAYTCSATFSVATTKSAKWSVGTGFSMSYTTTVGGSVGFSGPVGPNIESSFEQSLSVAGSFNAGYENTDTTTLTDTISVSVEVPKGTELTIDVKRVKNDLVYFWKGSFSIKGVYSVSQAGHKVDELDVRVTLSGDKGKFLSFGKWEYPDTDFHKVIITDKYGDVKKQQDCKELEKDDEKCKVSV